MSVFDTGLERASRIIDLTLPILAGGGRFGLTTEFTTPLTYDDVDWQGSVVKMFVHTGTHVDAPVHFLRDGVGIDEAPLDRLTGRGWVFDLTDAPQEIGPAELQANDPGLMSGEIAVLRTDWTDQSWGSDRFVADSPYLTVGGAQWLVDKDVKAIVYDFSEDYAVRRPGFRGDECAVHHLVLGHGIWNIEYVVGLSRLSSPSPTIIALPLKFAGLDGSPARVIAVE